MSTPNLNNIGLRGYQGELDPDLKIFLNSKDFFRFGGREVYPIVYYTKASDESKIKIIISDKKLAERESKLYRVFVTALKVVSLFTILVPLVVYIRGQLAKNRLGAKSFAIYTFTESGLKDFIRSADPQDQSYDRSRPRNPNDLDQILFGLFLGNGKSFLDCSGFEILDHDEYGQPAGRRDTSNPSKIQGIITMCPLTNLTKEGGDAEELFKPENLQNGEARLKSHFTKNGIDWSYPGRTISDMSSGRMGYAAETPASRLVNWTTFIYNTTYPNNPLTTFEPTFEPTNQKALVDSNLDKLQSVNDHIGLNKNAQDWFAPAFQMMDRAVFKEEKILIHCAEGKSRSAALVIAYLMNRFDVTQQEAECFVRSMRPSTNTKFSPELAEYGNSLKSQDAAQTDRIWSEETIEAAKTEIQAELQAQLARKAV